MKNDLISLTIQNMELMHGLSSVIQTSLYHLKRLEMLEPEEQEWLGSIIRRMDQPSHVESAKASTLHDAKINELYVRTDDLKRRMDAESLRVPQR